MSSYIKIIRMSCKRVRSSLIQSTLFSPSLSLSLSLSLYRDSSLKDSNLIKYSEIRQLGRNLVYRPPRKKKLLQLELYNPFILKERHEGRYNFKTCTQKNGNWTPLSSSSIVQRRRVRSRSSPPLLPWSTTSLTATWRARKRCSIRDEPDIPMG